jgi:hypothetical protein
VHPDVPIEESVAAMAAAQAAGKVRHIGLANVSADELRRPRRSGPSPRSRTVTIWPSGATTRWSTSRRARASPSSLRPAGCPTPCGRARRWPRAPGGTGARRAGGFAALLDRAPNVVGSRHHLDGPPRGEHACLMGRGHQAIRVGNIGRLRRPQRVAQAQRGLGRPGTSARSWPPPLPDGAELRHEPGHHQPARVL